MKKNNFLLSKKDTLNSTPSTKEFEKNIAFYSDLIEQYGIFACQNQAFLDEFIHKSFETINHSLAFNSLSYLATDKDEKCILCTPFRNIGFLSKNNALGNSSPRL